MQNFSLTKMHLKISSDKRPITQLITWHGMAAIVNNTCQCAWDPCHGESMILCLNLVNMLRAMSCKIMIIAGHHFAHVLTAKQSWHVQSCDLIESVVFTLQQTVYFNGLDIELIKPPVKGVHGLRKLDEIWIVAWLFTLPMTKITFKL